MVVLLALSFVLSAACLVALVWCVCLLLIAKRDYYDSLSLALDRRRFSVK